MSIVLVQQIGIIGVAIGMLIADILICGWFIPLDTCRIIGENIGKYWLEVVVRGLPLIVIGWGVALSLAQLNILPLLSILATGGSLASVGIGLGYFFWLSSSERVQVLSIRTALRNKVV